MSRKNWKDASVRFKADRDDVMEYAGPDASFTLRCGLQEIKSKEMLVREIDKKETCAYKLAKRRISHNGKNVPRRFETKPKRFSDARKTIRRPAYLEFLAEKEAEGIIYNYLPKEV